MQTLLPADFNLLHMLNVVLLFAGWFGYPVILRLMGKQLLNAHLSVARRRWVQMMTRRTAKPFDAVLLGHIVHAVAFFGSATLIVLAGVISAFVGIDSIHATAQRLHFVSAGSIELFSLEFGLLVLVLSISFFSFTYALRKLIYSLALIGALPEVGDAAPHHDILVEDATTVLTEAVTTFNFGIRGYYYAIAVLALIVSPVAGIVTTVAVTGILIWRQVATTTASAILHYVQHVDGNTGGR